MLRKILGAAGWMGMGGLVFAAGTLLPQPDSLPGEWKEVPIPLPPLETITSKPTPSLPVYGLYAWANEFLRHRSAVREVGWRSLRISGPMTDAAMKVLIEENIEVMKTLQLGNLEGDASEKFKNRSHFPSDEDFLDGAERAAMEFLKRYGPGGTFFAENPSVPVRPVTLVEIWNEPNFRHFIPDRQPRKEIEAEREALYARLLPRLYQSIKANYPTVRVLAFATGGGGSSLADRRFIEGVHAKNDAVGRSYDILSTHPYNDEVGPELMRVKPYGGNTIAHGFEALQGIMARYAGGTRPVWYTEIGWQISPGDGGQSPAKEGATEKGYVSPLLMAAHVCRLYALAMRLGVERAHIMFLLDSDGFNGGFFSRQDGSWRPSAHAVKEMIRQMPNPRISAAVSDGVDGTYMYEVETDAISRPGDRLLLAWNAAGPRAFSIPVKGNRAMVTDMLGTGKVFVAENGSVTVPIGPFPVTVRGRSGGK